jgi:hypothetical protein
VDLKLAPAIVSEADEIRFSNIASVSMGCCFIVVIDCDGGERNLNMLLTKVQQQLVEVGALPAVSGVIRGEASASDRTERLRASISRNVSVLVERDRAAL